MTINIFYQKGCLDDSDCSAYGTECAIDGPHKYHCILKKCPKIAVENGIADTEDKEVNERTVLSCRKGFVYQVPLTAANHGKRLKAKILLCIINAKNSPVWVEEDTPSTAFMGKCVIGKYIS